MLSVTDKPTMPSGIMLSVLKLSVPNKPIMLSVTILSVANSYCPKQTQC
jgi:hypothetical protein